MNLDFRSEMALAGARAFAAGLRDGRTGVKGGATKFVAVPRADDATATDIIATIVTEATKELVAAG